MCHAGDTRHAARAIRKAIRDEDKRLRSKHAILREENQDIVGVAIFLVALVMWSTVSMAWVYGKIGGLAAVVTNSLTISIFHEMEHDLIHDLYLKRVPVLQHVMFFVIWILKAGTAPWWRKRIHLQHHLQSGQVDDVEERLLGLGMPWTWKRVLVTVFASASLLLVPDIVEEYHGFDVVDMLVWNVPMSTISTSAMVFYWTYPAIVYNVCIGFPNILRHVCLVVITTWVHYYDIPPKDVFYQTQIVDHLLLLPFQLFCFNFGATHGVHHYITKQPFYLRQMVAPRVIPVMKEQGVRCNDLGSNVRSNRW